jgi:hypothetical protein
MPVYYKKQVEVAREFSVSEGTITNWIKGSLASKNNLQLFQDGKDYYILKSEHNRVTMLNLAEKGRKFRSDDSEVDVTVKEELYEIMTENQLISLINSLRVYKEIPMKFSYLGGGAVEWKKFYKKTLNNQVYSGADIDRFLLGELYPFLENYIKQYDKINVIDIGSGTGSPVKELVEKINISGKLLNYYALDISPKIISEVVENVELDSFKDKIRYEIVDFETQSLQDILYKTKDYSSKTKTCNVLLFIGATIGNFNSQNKVLENIKDGMLHEDILIVSNAYDIVTNRTSFPKFEIEGGDGQEIYIPSLLGIKSDYFDKELIYNDKNFMREYNLILNRNLNIHFEKFNILLELKKGQRINVWKHRRDTFEFISDKIKQAGMELQFIAKHPTDPEVIYMSKLV